MPSDDEFESLKGRVGALEGEVGQYRGRATPSAAEIQDYVKVRNALTVEPVDLLASEIRNYLRVRDFLLAEVEHFAIPTCGGSRRRMAADPGAVGRMRDLGR